MSVVCGERHVQHFFAVVRRRLKARQSVQFVFESYLLESQSKVPLCWIDAAGKKQEVRFLVAEVGDIAEGPASQLPAVDRCDVQGRVIGC